MNRFGGIAHDFSMFCACERAHPPPSVPAERAGRLLGLGAGRLFSPCVSAACRQLLAEARGTTAAAAAAWKTHRGHHAPSRPQTEAGRRKKQPQQCTVDSVCPLVLIFAEPVCGSAGRDAHMTHKRADFTGFKSILSNVCFLSGLDSDYTGRMAGLSYCRVTLDHTFSTFFHPGKTSTTCVVVVFQR